MSKKDFIKITVQDIEIAEDFFDNDKHLNEFLINVIRYYRGKPVVIKTKIVQRFFKTYQKTMDFILASKIKGKYGASIKAENERVRQQTLEGSLEAPLETKKKEERDKKKEEIKSVLSFDEFWKMYPNKTAKKAAEKKYKNVTESNRQKIKDTLNTFINNKPFESYTIPNPATYIFNERWTDEITIKNKVHSSGVILGLDVLYQAASVTGGMQRLSDKYGYSLEELKEMYNAALIKGGHKPVIND
jgi:hypothetical protein